MISAGLLLLGIDAEYYWLERWKEWKRSRPDAPKVLDYGDSWRTGGLGPGGFLREGFSARVTDGYGGSFLWRNNSQGFRSDREFSKERPPGTRRILSLGDSFAAGYRVRQGRTYSDLLADWVSRESGPAEVLISCIENPRTGLQYLRSFGIGWDPQIVLLGITLANDISQDYSSAAHPKPREPLSSYKLPPYCRDERPRPSATRLQRFGNWVRSALWPFIPRVTARTADFLFPGGYAAIPVTRWGSELTVFDAYTSMGLFLRRATPEVEDAYLRHFEVLSEFKAYCDSKGILFVVMLHSGRFQIQSRDWDATIRKYRFQRSAFDLREPNRRIREFCLKKGIPVVDPIEHMTTFHELTGKDLFLPCGDMHWNEWGHRVWFWGAKDILRPILRAQDRRLSPASN